MHNEIKEGVDHLPEPDTLALKSSNRTVPISLRVREDSYNYYVSIAEKNGTTPTAVINELINTYAALYNEENKPYNADFTMTNILDLCKYMREQLDLFRDLSDVQLLTRVYECCNCKNLTHDEIISNAKIELIRIRTEDKNRCRYQHFIKNCPIICTSNYRARVEGDTLEVQSNVWPLVAACTMTFIKKRNELLGQNSFAASKPFLKCLEFHINNAYSRNALVNRLKMKFHPSGAAITPADLLPE